jgi:hypothetical protein
MAEIFNDAAGAADAFKIAAQRSTTDGLRSLFAR